MKKNVLVVGLGKLGLPSALSFAAGGHAVTGYDSNESWAEAVASWLEDPRRKPPLDEPELRVTVAEAQEHNGSLTVCKQSGLTKAVAEADAIFLVVPTPSKNSGSFDASALVSCLAVLGPGLRDAITAGRTPLVVCVSTVSPGTCDDVLIPALERETGEEHGRFLLAYNPEFIALGSVVKDFRNPDFLLCGTAFPEVVDLLCAIYEPVVWGGNWNAQRFRVMSCVSAELAKLALNCFVTTKIAYANTIARVCENFAGADVDAVLGAIGCDRRVGPCYLRAGTPYGGPCFPRDGRALLACAPQDDLPLIPAAWDTNENSIDWLVEAVLAHAPKGPVCIFGRSYKPGTPVAEESASVVLQQRLETERLRVIVHDPTDRKELSPVVAATDCAVLVVMHDSPVYRNLHPRQLDEVLLSHALVIDCWRIYRDRPGWKRAQYYPVGIGDANARS